MNGKKEKIGIWNRLNLSKMRKMITGGLFCRYANCVLRGISDFYVSFICFKNI